MIRGTTPPDDLWPDAPAAYVQKWHRERRLLESLLGTKRSRRGSAVELSCRCTKSHLLLSVIVLPDDELAVWFHGGGWLNESSLVTPGSESLELKYRAAGLAPNYTVPDSLDIVSLTDLRDGQGLRGNVTSRCAPPHTITADDRAAIAAAVDKWKIGKRDTPYRASMVPV